MLIDSGMQIPAKIQIIALKRTFSHYLQQIDSRYQQSLKVADTLDIFMGTFRQQWESHQEPK